MERNIRCAKCKDMYVYFGAINEVTFCPECNKKEANERSAIREYIRTHPGVNPTKLTEEFNLPIKKIRKYMEEGAFEAKGSDLNYLLCENCKTPINRGKLCNDCIELSEKEKNK